MTTRLRLSRDYPRDVAVFASALADPAFHLARLDTVAGGELVEHRVERERVVVTVRQPIAPGNVPAVIERLLSGSLVLTKTERWELGDARCDGRVEVVVPRAPVTANGTMTVVPIPGGCRLDIAVAATVSIPFAGALVEPAVADGIRTLTTAEHDRISEWFATSGPAGT